MEKQIQKIKNKLKASALVVTMIILGIMLVSALSMALVAIQERKASMGENTSNQAYNKAEDGVEKVMQLMKDHAGGKLSDISCSGGIITSTEGGYTVKFKDATDSFITDCGASISSVKSVKSIGTVGQNQRAVEVAVAGTGCEFVKVGKDCYTTSGQPAYCGGVSSYMASNTMNWLCQNKKGSNYFAVSLAISVRPCVTGTNYAVGAYERSTRTSESNDWAWESYYASCPTTPSITVELLSGVYCCPTPNI